MILGRKKAVLLMLDLISYLLTFKLLSCAMLWPFYLFFILRQERMFNYPFAEFIPCSSFLRKVSQNLCLNKDKVKSIANLVK